MNIDEKAMTEAIGFIASHPVNARMRLNRAEIRDFLLGKKSPSDITRKSIVNIIKQYIDRMGTDQMMQWTNRNEREFLALTMIGYIEKLRSTELDMTGVKFHKELKVKINNKHLEYIETAASTLGVTADRLMSYIIHRIIDTIMIAEVGDGAE